MRVRRSDGNQTTSAYQNPEICQNFATRSTDAEQILWYHLRARRLAGLELRRQHPIPPYIADFYCEALRLVVELDGSQHNETVDFTRTQTIERQGFHILRFWDNQVLQETESVLEAILDFAQERTLTPAPLPQGEGL